MTVIRSAHPEEIDHLPTVEMDAGRAFRSLPDLAWLAEGEPLLPAVHREHLANDTVWVAVETETVAATAEALRGFLTAELTGEHEAHERHQLHILEVSVRQAAQGHGIGRRLIEHAITRARGRGLRSVTLTTFRDVPWNAPFYSRLGFSILEDGQLDDRLREILRLEAEHGLPLERRCAMQLVL